jgi:enamine deaminase RidA (YjgF/YER057c/UK114 family)
MGEGDPALQAETAMRCSDELLREAGASLNDVVKLTVYMTDREYRAPVFSVLKK